MRLVTLVAAMLSSAAAPAIADSVTGIIVAYDRVDAVIVLTDKTIWNLVPKDFPVPENLVAGERVRIDFVSNGDSGLGKVIAITREDG
jgi:hypothetical protein